MKSLANALPPEIARQIHPDWRKNEAAYWLKRDALLSQFNGQWIAFAEGAVIAAASTPLEVFLAIQNSDHHPFVVRAGHEDEPWYHIRRATFLSASGGIRWPRTDLGAGLAHAENRVSGHLELMLLSFREQFRVCHQL